MKKYTLDFQYRRLERKIREVTELSRRASKSMGEAAELGDLPENSEFLYAADERNLQNARLAELSNQISNLEVLSRESISTQKTGIGTKVTFKNLESDNKEVYNLVGDGPSNFDEREVSYLSPLGKGFLGHQVGDKIEIKIPVGNKKY